MLSKSASDSLTHFSLTSLSSNFHSIGENYSPNTLRQTSVVVLPNTFGDFNVFDKLCRQILAARREARDYVMGLRPEEEEDWSVSVNCNHLHPQYGQKSPEEELADLKKESDEVDVHYLEYQRKKKLAYQSPYPTVVLEVRSTPTPDFGSSPAPSSSSTSQEEESTITAADVARLEALFGKSTVKSKDEGFYQAIGDSFSRKKSVNTMTPMQLAQTWMTQHDESLSEPHVVAAFTESSTCEDVDVAYEFVFSNIAMLQSQAQTRQYLVLPRFLATAATSLEQFGRQVEALCDCVPALQRIRVQTFHPENVDPEHRAPVPILLIDEENK